MKTHDIFLQKIEVVAENILNFWKNSETHKAQIK